MCTEELDEGVMDLVRSLTGSIKDLFASGIGDEVVAVEDLPVYDSRACVDCSDPCTEHEWVPESMKRKLKMNTPLAAKPGKPASRIVFMCTGQTGAQWSAKPSKGTSLWDKRLQGLEGALEGADTHVFFCSAPSTSERGYDLLVFPECVRMNIVPKEEHEEEHEGPLTLNWSSVDFAALPPLTWKCFMFVCTHRLRDKRCGVGGSLCFNALLEEAEARQRHDLAIFEMAHVGGHAYAGNVLAFPGAHLFGRVTPCHAKLVVDMVRDTKVETPPEIYRGCMLRSK